MSLENEKTCVVGFNVSVTQRKNLKQRALNDNTTITKLVLPRIQDLLEAAAPVRKARPRKETASL